MAPPLGCATRDSVHCAPAPARGARGEAAIVEHRSRGRDGQDRQLIGWSESVDLPEWGIRGIRAKVDTGARTSALHVENVEELPNGRVRFDVVLHRRRRDRRVHVVSRVRRRARVRSSTGHYSTRIFVATLLRLGDVEREVELSLVDREHMLFRMLLGRSALGGAFLIDPAHRGLLGRHDVTRSSQRRRPHPGPGSSTAS